MDSMTSSTSPVTDSGPVLFDSFGTPLTPGAAVARVRDGQRVPAPSTTKFRPAV